MARYFETSEQRRIGGPVGQPETDYGDPGIEMAFKMDEQFPYGGPEAMQYWPVWHQTGKDTGMFLPRYVR